MSTLIVDSLKTTDGNHTVDVKDITGLAVDFVFNQPKSGNFWIDVHPNAKIHRINDRILMGGATDNDGEITSTVSAATKDWLTLLRLSTTDNSQLAVLSTIGQCAILGGSRSSDFSSAGSMGCIGLQGWAINDNTAFVQTVYGAYLEVRRNVGTGNTQGFELDVINYGNQVSVQPYDMFQTGLTVGGWFASGGELSETRASAAIAIINNGSTWEKGIVFHSTSLDGTDGITGSGVAMEMAKGHTIRWMFGSGSQGATVSSSISNSAAAQNLLFSDIGVLFRNGNAVNLLQIAASDTYVNGIAITPGNASVSPAIGAVGSDTNLNLTLTPKGTGVVNFAGAQVIGTAGTQAGYVLIAINGSMFKLPYYNV